MGCGRFAPSTTGEAHAGTLMAALLAWLDARGGGHTFVVRFEDIDPARCQLAYRHDIRRALEWLGLDWDREVVQSTRRPAHEGALDQLAARGLVYPCNCSRQEVRRRGRPAPDGGVAYPNTCRDRPLPPGGWRACAEPLRVRVSDTPVRATTLDGEVLVQAPGVAMGDPVVRRRDGAIAYQLAVVVDDAAVGVTRVVRGRDVEPSTATQVCLYEALGLTPPVYMHHLLLLETRGEKHSKTHGSVGWSALRERSSGPELVGTLAAAVGLLPRAGAVAPRDLLAAFDWRRVRQRDLVAIWGPRGLALTDPRLPT